MTTSKRRPEPACPISYALEIFGDRWTLLVLRDLLLTPKRRYGELLASPEGIATNILADRLKRLEGRGLVNKARDPVDSRQFIYAPTERAISLIPMLLELIVWSAKTGDVKVDSRILRDFRRDREACVRRLQEAVRKTSGQA
jgi:DNA-binding HxlR family transcriptional regulator